MTDRRGVVIHPQELDENWIRRLTEGGMNLLGIHPVGGTQADASLRDMIEDDSLPEKRELYRLAREKGIQIEYEMHALSYLLPRRLFSVHPEWFRMDETGERVPDFNFCPSQPQALGYIERRAARLAAIFPAESHRYFFWLDDVAGYRCHCPACRSLCPSDQQLLAVNALQRGVRQTDPCGRMAYLAYVDTVCPPKTVRPEPGIFLEFAPFKRNFNRPIDDPDCAENASEIRGLPDLLDFFGREGSQVLDYWADNSLYSGWKKPPKPFVLNTEVMRRDARFYRRMGFETITGFACYLGADYAALYGEPPLREYGRILRESDAK